MVKPEIRKLIEETAKKYKINPDLVEAHVMVESSGNPQATRFEPQFYEHYVLPLNLASSEARGRSTSYGLLQIMGQVSREMGFKGNFPELLDPAIGLEWGCKKLAKCYERFGKENINAGIAAYNSGTPRINQTGFVNQVYVDKINYYLRKIKGAEV